MKVNTKNSPITIRLKPLGSNLVQIVVFNSITGEEFLHVFNFTKKYKEVEEEPEAVDPINDSLEIVDELVGEPIINAAEEVEEGVKDEND